MDVEVPVVSVTTEDLPVNSGYQIVSAELTDGSGLRYRGAPVTTTATGTSVEVPAPSGLQAGDLVLIYVSSYSGPNGTFPGFSSQSGPTSVMTTAVYYRVCDGTEGASFTGTGFNIEDGYVAAVICVGIANIQQPWSDPSAVPPVCYTYASSEISVPSITLAQPSDVLIGFFSGPGLPGDVTPPEGFTTRATSGVATQPSHVGVTAVFADKSHVPAGPTSAQYAINSSAGNGSSWIVGIPGDSYTMSGCVSAPAGTKVVGGGFSVPPDITSDVLVTSSTPAADGSSWNINANVSGDLMSTTDSPITVYAICMAV